MNFFDVYKNLYVDSDLVFEPREQDNEKNVEVGGGIPKLKSSTLKTTKSKKVTKSVVQPPNEISPSLEEVQIELEYDWDQSNPETNSQPMSINANQFQIYPNHSVYSTHYDKELDLWSEIPILYHQATSPGFAHTWLDAIEKEKAAMRKHNV